MSAKETEIYASKNLAQNLHIEPSIHQKVKLALADGDLVDQAAKAQCPLERRASFDSSLLFTSNGLIFGNRQ